MTLEFTKESEILNIEVNEKFCKSHSRWGKILLITLLMEKTQVITGNIYFHFWWSNNKNKTHL